MAHLSRRVVVTRLGALTGFGGAVSLATASPAGASPTSAAPTTLTLHVSGLRVLGPRQRAQPGVTRTLRGVVRESESGAQAGEFFASSVVLAEHRSLDPELGSFETQLFTLSDGTLTGSGTVHHDGTGAFTLTGGTGRFAGAHGSYSSSQSADHSGGGAGLFTFEIGRH